MLSHGEIILKPQTENKFNSVSLESDILASFTDIATPLHTCFACLKSQEKSQKIQPHIEVCGGGSSCKPSCNMSKFTQTGATACAEMAPQGVI